MSNWTVWVGGLEVNEYLIKNKNEALNIAKYWTDEGYDDVVVEEVANA